MSHSSTSSSDSDPASWRPGRWVLVLLLFIGSAELLLRHPLIAERLPRPEPTLWHAPNVQTKIDHLRALAATRGVDVLFVGNSTVLAGIDPEVFDESRGAGTDQRPAAFNG